MPTLPRVPAAPARRTAALGLAVLASAIHLPCATPAAAQDDPDLAVREPAVFLDGVPFSLTLRSEEPAGGTFLVEGAGGRELASGLLPGREDLTVDLEAGDADLPLRVTLTAADGRIREVLVDAPRFPGWISLLPPLVAILLALVFREVILSLFVGIWIGALFVAGLNPLSALWRAVDTFVVPSVADPGNASILVFTALLGGMVGIISRSGGTRGIVEAVRPLATSPRRAQLATFFGGIGIFFDDYANTLIVGNTFRPITDRLRVSREKLAYIVDSTAAPVVTIVFVSTWVGFEISQIRLGLEIAAQQATDPTLAAALADASPFTVLLRSIPHLFYPILALVMVALVIVLRRDFGPMHRAERRARSGEGVFRADSQLLVDTEDSGLDAKPGAPLRWQNAALPILAVVVVVLLGLYVDGRGAIGRASIWDTFGAADPFKALLWGSLAGCVVAVGLSVAQRILSLQEAMGGWVSGARAMMIGYVILVLAWSLGKVTADLGTARYLTLLLEGTLTPEWLPAVTFVVAAAISFATGTSWTTMTILLPLVVPLIVALGGAEGFFGGTGGPLLVGTVSSVLGGAIFGDHCSPISDTTVMSSMASACDHMDHVRTQLPYAIVVMLVGLAFGDLATSFGLPVPVAYVLAIGTLVAIVRFVGRPVDRATDPA